MNASDVAPTSGTTSAPSSTIMPSSTAASSSVATSAPATTTGTAGAASSSPSPTGSGADGSLKFARDYSTTLLVAGLFAVFRLAL